MEINVSCVDDRYSFVVTGASYIGAPKPNTVMYATKKVGYLTENLRDVHDCLAFVETGTEVSEDIRKNNCIKFTDNPKGDYALFMDRFVKQIREEEKNRRYTLTGGGYYIGENVTIGENAYIEPGALIGHDVVIGRDATILAGAVIKHAVIGDGFYANENCVVGGNGFTMALDNVRRKIRIPTLGRVVIGNNVEIGQLANVSRGSAGETVLEDNVKIDAFVHIGHDAHLGKHNEIPAAAIIGGFVRTEDYAFVSLNATVRNRITLGEGSFVGMGAVVTKSVEDNVTVVGNPARKFEKGV